MEKDGCPSCRALQHDCGGHWKTAARYASSTGKRGSMSLDVYDGTHDHDAHAYKEYETDD